MWRVESGLVSRDFLPDGDIQDIVAVESRVRMESSKTVEEGPVAGWGAG